MASRVLLTTFGSYGDLNPFLAIAGRLKQGGHHPVIGSVAAYKDAIESAGFEFALVRSALVERTDQELTRKVFDRRHGPEYLVRNLLMPAIRVAYEDTARAAKGASLLVSHPLTFATRLVAERFDMRWMSVQLSPLGFFSAFDPPVLPNAPFLRSLYWLGPRFFRMLMSWAKRSAGAWTQPYREYRRELGLGPGDHPLFEGSHSPSLVLGMFSPCLAEQQPDWPQQSVVTGFPFHDLDGELSEELQRFLDAGDPPIVFTLGTAAVYDAGRFYAESALAAQMLGRRAVLLTGPERVNRPASLPKSVIAVDYASFAKLFPRASAIVHQGGVGTTGQAMRAGVPMLVMPYAVDQPDNAARASRLGIARVVEREEYSAQRAAWELDELFKNPSYRIRSAQVGMKVKGEDGASVAYTRARELMA